MVINADDVNQLLKIIRSDPSSVFNIPAFRKVYAVRRWNKHKTIKIHNEDNSSDIAPGTVSHNRREIDDGLFGSVKRTVRLLGPLSGLSPIYEMPERLKVLSIGPRTEMEIFHLLALGFRLENVHAIDLISSSEFIKCGDMHALPYSDSMFDVVISSWVLNYSTNPKKAMMECLRVSKTNGLIAVGTTHSHSQPTFIADKGLELQPDAIIGSTFASTSEVLNLISDKYDYQCVFRQEPADLGADKMMFIIRKR